MRHTYLKLKSFLALTLLLSVNSAIQAQTTYTGDLILGEYPPGAFVNSQSCEPSATTWFLGGNNIIPPIGWNPLFTTPNTPMVQTDAGTCNDFPFILKANNFQSVFITQKGKIGINTPIPGAALDVREPGQVYPIVGNFRIYGDVDGNLESLTDINMTRASGNNIYFNEGVANSNVKQMVLLSGGNLGLGTMAPTTKFSVQDYETPTQLGNGFSCAMRLSNQFANTFGGKSEIQFALGQNSNEQIAVIAGEYSNYNSGVGGDLVFGTAQQAVIKEQMRITYDGEVGIGTSSPDHLLHLKRSSGSNYADATIRLESTLNSGRKWDIVSSGGSGLLNSGWFGIVDPTSNVSRLTIEPTGKVGVGTTNFPTTIGGANISTYRLFVKGGILTDELRVRTGWADYVFLDDYKLAPLSEVAAFIEKNGHLPNVPSAAQVEEEGIEMGEMTRIQQEKIEELTLYIIELQKQMDQLKAQFSEEIEK